MNDSNANPVKWALSTLSSQGTPGARTFSGWGGHNRTKPNANRARNRAARQARKRNR